MENRKVSLTRVYRFSAAHYLSSPFLSDDENRQTYGKCGRTAGHGHNYVLKVTVKGTVDPVTGMVMDTRELDNIVTRYVIDPLDHKNLNVELKAIPIPTSEVLVEAIWNRLAPHIKSPPLYKIEVDETRKNGFKYFGEK